MAQIQSFSHSDKPCHNAVMESFFASLKREELYRRNYHPVKEFKECVRKYIDSYNMERPHSTQTLMKPCVITGKQRKKNRHRGSKAAFRRFMR